MKMSGFYFRKRKAFPPVGFCEQHESRCLKPLDCRKSDRVNYVSKPWPWQGVTNQLIMTNCFLTGIYLIVISYCVHLKNKKHKIPANTVLQQYFCICLEKVGDNWFQPFLPHLLAFWKSCSKAAPNWKCLVAEIFNLEIIYLRFALLKLFNIMIWSIPNSNEKTLWDSLIAQLKWNPGAAHILRQNV